MSKVISEKMRLVIIAICLLLVGCRLGLRQPQSIHLPLSDFAMKSDSADMKAPIRVLFFVSKTGCSFCKLSLFQEFEARHRDAYEKGVMDFVYVVETDSSHLYTTYAMLCNARLKGHVYIYDAQVFLSSNPTFTKEWKNFAFFLDYNHRVRQVIPIARINE